MKWFVFLASTLFAVALFAVVFVKYSDITIVAVEPGNKLDVPSATLSAVNISSFEYEILEEVNKVRVSSGLLPLSSNAKTQDIAVARTSDMQANQYYDHTSPSGIGLKNLIPKGSGLACENLLLSNPSTAEEIVSEWIKSPSHKECLLSERTTIAGISIGKFDQNVDSTLESQIVTFIASER